MCVCVCVCVYKALSGA